MANAVKVIVEQSGKEYHSLSDWGCVIGNRDYLGDPVVEETIVEIPGGITLDLSEATTGSPIYKERPINIVLGGKHPQWEHHVSIIRTAIHGKMCKIIFDNDIHHYYRGRIKVVDFSATGRIGQFTISMEHAEPWRYNLYTNQEMSNLWNKINFNTDKKEPERLASAFTLAVANNVVIPSGGSFYLNVVFERTSGTGKVKITAKNKTVTLDDPGTYLISEIPLGDEDTNVKFEGNSGTKINVSYRRRYL